MAFRAPGGPGWAIVVARHPLAPTVSRRIASAALAVGMVLSLLLARADATPPALGRAAFGITIASQQNTPHCSLATGGSSTYFEQLGAKPIDLRIRLANRRPDRAARNIPTIRFEATTRNSRHLSGQRCLSVHGLMEQSLHAGFYTICGAAAIRLRARTDDLYLVQPNRAPCARR